MSYKEIINYLKENFISFNVNQISKTQAELTHKLNKEALLIKTNKDNLYITIKNYRTIPHTVSYYVIENYKQYPSFKRIWENKKSINNIKNE